MELEGELQPNVYGQQGDWNIAPTSPVGTTIQTLVEESDETTYMSGDVT